MVTVTTTATGSIVALITGGFEIQNPHCGYLRVYTNTSTIFVPAGGKPVVGMTAQVTGTGSCATSITATQVTLTGGSSSIPVHVNTGAYLYSSDNATSHGRPFSAYAPSLTWAETYSGSAVSAAGIKTLLYTNPNREETTDPFYNTNEKTFAHTCSGARITQPNSAKTIYLMDPTSPDMVNLYKSYVANELSKQNFTAILDDEPFDWYALSAMPCNYVAASWLNAYAAEMTALNHPVIYSGLSSFGPNNTLAPTMQFNSSTIGGLFEGCYAAHWNPTITSGVQWVATENTELAMAQQNKLFICMPVNYTTASTSSGIAIRLFVYASFLLTYDVSTTSLWDFFGTASSYGVEPESELVALSPVVPAPAAVTTLQQSSGVYARQYGACYIAGKSVGPCAAVVNPDAFSAHAFPYTTYHHTLLLTGGGILDGGRVSTTGGAPPSSMAPLSGVIAFQ